MNQALKHWREAATIILAASVGNRNVVINKKQLPLIQKNVNGWPLKIDFDYEVLLLKRSQASGFMPSAYVFPGGMVDASDFSSEWMEVFKPYKKEPNFGLGLVKQQSSTRAPIFATDRKKCGSPIPGEVAFRICAIRETFEESGILLAVPKNFDTNSGQELTTIMHFNTDEISTWRQKVQEDPSHFIQMCQELHCIPNIWALHEWSNWLTPAYVRDLMPRRYDTAFFICCLQDQPHTLDDQKEVTSFQWSTPSEIIENYESTNLWIPPPQFYELRRIAQLPLLHDLHQFSTDRALEGCERWMPVTVVKSDSIIQLLPGDELYPEDPDWTGEKESTLPPELLQKRCSKIHRIEYWNRYSATIYVNIEPKFKHLCPVVVSSNSCTDFNSHL